MATTFEQLKNAFRIAELVFKAHDVNSFAEEAEKIKASYSRMDWTRKMKIVERNLDSQNAEARNIVSSLSK